MIYSDVHARVSFWYSLTELGLSLPRREAIQKETLAEEERIRKAILEARARLAKDDSDVPCKVVRMIVGYKMEEGEEKMATNELRGMDNRGE